LLHEKKSTIILIIIPVLSTMYYSTIYFIPYTEGVKLGELIKISNKGVLYKTREGKIS